MDRFLLVFAGAGLGGALRHGINLATLRLLGPRDFPVGTLFINVAGSFLMGVIAESFALRGGSMPLRLFLTTGLLGGFTTFSAFSLEAGLLYERGELTTAGLYVAASVILSLAGLFAGLAASRTLLAGS